MTGWLVATAGQEAWTPEVFYVVMAIVHLIVLLVGFRLMGVVGDYNKFVNALLVVVPANVIAFFTRDLGMIGVLITATVFFLFLVAGSRGDIGKSFVVWTLVILTYWGVAFYVVEVEYALQSEELGGIPYLFLEGEMDGHAVTQDDYRRIRGD